MRDNGIVVNFSKSRNMAEIFCQQHRISDSHIKQVFINEPGGEFIKPVNYTGLYEPDTQNILRPVITHETTKVQPTETKV